MGFCPGKSNNMSGCYEIIDGIPEIPVGFCFKVGNSNINLAGDGLFTEQTIPANIIIGEYSGYIADDSEMTEKESDYAFHLGFGVSVVGTGIMSKINDNVDMDASTAENIIRYDRAHQHNCIFVKYAEGEFARVYVRTLVEVPKKSELFINYGDEYWKYRIQKNKH